MYYRPEAVGLSLALMMTLILLSLRKRRTFLSMYPEKRWTYDGVVTGFLMIAAGLAVFMAISLKNSGDVETWRTAGNTLLTGGLAAFIVGWVDLLRRLSVKHPVSYVVEFVEEDVEHVPPGLYLCLSPDGRIIRKLLTSRAGMIISRCPENATRERFGIERIPVFWLTKVEGKNTVNPRRLEYLTQLVVSFLTKNDDPKTVLIEGVEYIAVEVGFSALFKFLTIIKDYALVNDAIVLVIVGEDTFSEKEWALLRREFPTLKEKEWR